MSQATSWTKEIEEKFIKYFHISYEGTIMIFISQKTYLKIINLMVRYLSVT